LLGIKANQIDYHHRILDWFGYLKGEPHPGVDQKGTSVLDREEELKAGMITLSALKIGEHQ
jgi:hypothetical protein